MTSLELSQCRPLPARATSPAAFTAYSNTDRQSRLDKHRSITGAAERLISVGSPWAGSSGSMMPAIAQRSVATMALLVALGVLSACDSRTSTPIKTPRVVGCLRHYNAFLQRTDIPANAPPAEANLDFGFAARPAPLNEDSGSVILARDSSGVSEWLTFLRTLGVWGVAGPDNSVIVWNIGRGHPTTRRIIDRCIKQGLA